MFVSLKVRNLKVRMEGTSCTWCSREGFLEEWVGHEDWAKNSHTWETFAGA